MEPLPKSPGLLRLGAVLLALLAAGRAVDAARSVASPLRQPSGLPAVPATAAPGAMPASRSDTALSHMTPAPTWVLSAVATGTDPWAHGDLGSPHRFRSAAASALKGAQAGDALTMSSSGTTGGDAPPRPPRPGPPPPTHKPLWPLSGTDAVMLVLIAAALVFAAGGGIGGGALYMPLYVIQGGFAAGEAVALSNLTILGGAVANLALNSRRPHPLTPGKPLIDWGLALLMEPTTVLGALVGSYANKVLPSTVTVTLLSALLTLLTLQLIRRGARTFRAETQAHAAAAAADDPYSSAAEEGGLREPLLITADREDGAGPAGNVAVDALSSGGGSSGSWGDDATVLVADQAGSDLVNRDQGDGGADAATDASARKAVRARGGPGAAAAATENPVAVALAQPAGTAAAAAPLPVSVPAPAPRKRHTQLPALPLSLLGVLTVAVAASDMAKARVPCGSPGYWAIVLSVVPPAAAITWVARVRALRSAAAGGVGGNVKYTPRNTVLYPAICTIAGVVAGLFGLGGGVVKAPLMLELGVLPDVAAATSTTMILFTSASACAVYAGFGLIPVDYGTAVLVLGVVASAAGQLATTWVVRALGRRSVIIFVMATLIGIASVSAGFNAASRWSEVARGDAPAWEWGSICHDLSR